MKLIFRAYTKNTTTPLGILTDATDKRVSVHYNGPGTGSFSISRHSSQIAWCEPGNYVRVYIDSTSNDPIFAFFIESGNDTVVSRNEEGGETFQRGGRGALAYLERAIIDNSSTFGRYADTSWTWTNPTHGRIVKELIDDAQVRGALPLLTVDFTTAVESGGGTWAAIIGTYELPVGLDLLQMLQRQQSAGLVATMSPAFVLSCSEVIGTDLSGTITFEAGVNISEEVTRDVMASAAKSRMLVQGTTTAGTPFFRWVSDAPTETALGDRREGFVSYQATADTGTIDRVGLQAIRRLKRRHDGLSVLGVLTDEFVPFTDYQPGDTVTINVPGVWANLEAPITSIVLFDTATGEADCALEFEDIAFEPLQLKDRADPTPAGAGGGSGGGGGGGGTGGGGGAGGCSCGGCGGCAPWQEGTIDELGSFYDLFDRAFDFTGWGAASSSGHAWVGAGGYMSPGYGALTESSPGGGSTNEADTTTVPEFTAAAFRIEVDFSFRPYDSPDYEGDIFFDPGADITGYTIAMRLVATAGGGAYFGAGVTAAAAGLSTETPYTLTWTVDLAADTSRVQVAAYDVTSAIGPFTPVAGTTRNFIVIHNSANAPLTHITRIQSFSMSVPSSGQQVNNEAVGTGDGTTVTFTTDYPWRPGGIVVRINGIDVTDSVATFDPVAGDVTFATAPGIGSEITVSYVAA